MADRAGNPSPSPSPRVNLQAGTGCALINVERPVQPPQLHANFAALVTVFQNPGGLRTNPADTKAGRIGVLIGGLGIDLCFHIVNLSLRGCNAGDGEDPPPAPPLLSFEIRAGD